MLEGFAAMLKKLREDRGLTQKQLAEAAGLSYGIVRHYEQATRGPTWENVVALCRGLGVTCDVFMPAPEPAPVPPTPAARSAKPKRPRGSK